MKSKRLIKFNGEEFPNLKQLCKHYRVDYERFIYYYKSKKYTISACIKKARGKKIVYHGKEYSSLKDLCTKLNVNYSTVNRRLKFGLSVEQAIDSPKGCCKHVIKFNGKLYGSYKAIYDEYHPNVSYSGFVRRMKSLVGVSNVVSDSRLHKGCHSIVYNGIKYRNLMDFYKILDTKYSYSYLYNLYKKGVCPSEIVRIMSNGLGHISCNGVDYNSISDFIEKNNLSRHRVYKCMKKGYSAEKCLRVCKYSSYAFEYDGKVYNSLAEFCRVHNLKYTKVKYKVYDKGLSIYEALDELE